MIEHISTIVQRVMNSAYLARIENKVLDKYEELTKKTPAKKEETVEKI